MLARMFVYKRMRFLSFFSFSFLLLLFTSSFFSSHFPLSLSLSLCARAHARVCVYVVSCCIMHSHLTCKTLHCKYAIDLYHNYSVISRYYTFIHNTKAVTHFSCKLALLWQSCFKTNLSDFLDSNNDNEILLKHEPLVYTRPRRAVQRKERKKEEKKEKEKG